MGEGLHLSPSHREEITALLRKHLPNVEVWAYGSRVNGQSHDGSDLDLVLRGPDLVEIDTSRRADFIEALQDSTIPFLVEARDWVRLPESFHREIEREHVVLKDAVETKAHAQSEWRRAALNDVIDLRLSSVDKKSKANEHGVQLCNYTDVYNNSFIHVGMEFMTATATEQEIAKCSLVAGDVVITKDSEKHDDIGVPALVREDIRDLVCGYHLAILRPRLSEVDGAYLFYALSADDVQRQFHSYANGVTRFGLRKADIGLVEITLPPLRQQRAIAHILGTLDDKIELNRRMNETLEAMARALFTSWFVDFDPVRSKMEGRDTGLPKEIADLFPDRLVESELGEIPEGWAVGTLSDIADSSGTGIDPSAVDRDTTYIGLEHMPRHSVALTDWGSTGSVFSNKSRFSKGDVLFGKLRPYFHKVGIAPVNGICSTDIVVLTARMPELAAYVLACVSSPEFVSYTNQTSTGTKMPRTSWRLMGRYELCRPAEPIVRAFQRVVYPMLERIVTNIHESRTLGVIRDALLPKLVSGELRTHGICWPQRGAGSQVVSRVGRE